MEKWSSKFDACFNCSTTRFPHRGKGYCRRCYPLVIKLEQVKSWEESQPGTWAGFPNLSLDLARHFIRIKKGFSEQYSGRLSMLKYYEEKLKGPVTGLDLEYKFRAVGNLCGIDGDQLFGHDAGVFESQLDPDQRLFVYQKMHSIIEAKKWKGIDWYEVFNSK